MNTESPDVEEILGSEIYLTEQFRDLERQAIERRYPGCAVVAELPADAPFMEHEQACADALDAAPNAPALLVSRHTWRALLREAVAVCGSEVTVGRTELAFHGVPVRRYP